MTINLEHLPNEILHELFEYFDPLELIHAFRNLNIRFNQLLFFYFRSYRLDFRSISKANFNLICTQYLPGIIDHIRSFCLSDGDETPHLYEHLLDYNLTIDEFRHLQTLLLHKIDSTNNLLNITSDCFYLTYLTHLKIIECKFSNDINPKRLIYNIWHLNNLTHCTLDITFESSLSFSGLSIISKSLTHLSIKTYTFSLIELFHLFSLTPYLQHLSIVFGENVDIKSHQIISAVFLIRLELHFGGTLSTLKIILASVPNLKHFKLKTESINLDGNQWQQVLITYLPKIKTFRFLIRVLILKYHHVEEDLEEFFKTFQTPFWIDEHQWYVRCDWPRYANKLYLLYTLPYCFDDTYVIYQNQWSKTTSPELDNSHNYDRVTDVFYKGFRNNLSLLSIRYSNIRHLTLKLPHDKNIWTIIAKLNYLISLKVIEKQENSRSEYQLQDILNRAPRLSMLNIDALLFLRFLQINIHQHISVRRLQLIPYCSKTNRYLNAAQCSIFTNSSLGHHCEVLLIHIENRTIVLDLIHKMCNLRALHFECQDDYSSLHSNDELVEWLKNSLPKTYTIARHHLRLIQIWIHR